jgi:hypothetical protein
VKHRVERSIGDHGYRPGWLVLDAEGAVITDRPTWRAAFDCAFTLGQGLGFEGMVTERLDPDTLDQLGLADHLDRIELHILDTLTRPRRVGVVRVA